WRRSIHSLQKMNLHLFILRCRTAVFATGCYHKLKRCLSNFPTLQLGKSMQRKYKKLLDGSKYLLHLFYYCSLMEKNIFEKQGLFKQQNSKHKCSDYTKTFMRINRKRTTTKICELQKREFQYHSMY